MAFRPRKRASAEVARFRSYPSIDKPIMLGAFPGYKCGMIHVMMVDDHPNRPTYQQEIFMPCTVVEAPEITVFGITLYIETPYGLKPVTTIYKIPAMDKKEAKSRMDLSRAIQIPKAPVKDGWITNLDERMKIVDKNIDRIAEVRLLVHTNPRSAAVPKKKPEILEIPILGSVAPKEKLKFALNKLGSNISPLDVFEPGMFVDVTAVTKGKGFQSAVKRFGVKLLPHKAGKKRRGVASMGSRHPPYVRWTVPQPGQMGYHKRTEYNKRILKLGANPAEVNPKSGFKSYGLVRTNYILLSGSIPGPPKRFVLLRPAIRPPKWWIKLKGAGSKSGDDKKAGIVAPKITFISSQTAEIISKGSAVEKAKVK
uniref:50S ribosomal protein L3 n=1 Tax=uncultured korarchaeote TaxID=161241 RepID=A0A1L2JMC2_9CREN|nr:ribosomal protein L3 [uncultured korarchaeote]